MRALFYVLTAFGVIGLAIWAYGVNQQTQTAMREARHLRSEIRQLQESLHVQRAEWAYLNRPQRLRALVEMNFARLGLAALEGRQFGQIDEVPFPMLLSRSDEDREELTQ